MGWQSEQMITLPAWTPGEGSITLLERVHDEIPSEPEPFSPLESYKEECPCWWVLSALDFCDGKEAYYDGL